MRWLRIARKDLRDAARSRALYGVVALFVLLGVLLGYSTSPGPDGNALQRLPTALFAITSLLVGFVAVGISYESVVGPREDGSLQALLGLPYSRGDYVLGTLLGRTAVLAVAVWLGCIAAVATVAVRGLVPPVPAVLAVALVSTVVAAVFAGIGVGISAASGSTRSAGTLGFLVSLVLLFFWQALPGALAYVANGFSRPDTLPEWTAVVGTLNPVTALGILARPVVDPTSSTGIAARRVDSPTLAAVVVLVWLVGPALLGYLRFRDVAL